MCLIKPDTSTRSGVICDGLCVNDMIFLLKIFVGCGVDGVVIFPIVVACSTAVVIVAMKLVGGR